MKPNKAEVAALADILMQPLDTFVTEKERAEHKDPEGLAQNRMFTQAIEAFEEVRWSRTLWMVVVRLGKGPSTLYQGFGGYSTRAQAQRAADRILATLEVTAYAVVPTTGEPGFEAMLARADRDPEVKSDWLEVKRDGQARRNGWKGKASTRDRYLR